MIAETTQAAPYAPVDNVLTVIRRLRERGLPERLGLGELQTIGIPAGNAPRTLAALRFLGLVDEDGQRTQALERLDRATTEEYPQVLAEIVRAAYTPVFTIVDPAQDSDIALHDAFRPYEPKRQRPRMITLFLGLCREAGIVPGGPPARRARTRRTQVIKPEGIRSAEKLGRPEVKQEEPAPTDSGGADYRLLAALMQQLPKDGKWSKARRDRWIQAISASVDLLVEITVEDGGN